MQATSIIGQSITITGDITADEPLTIAGHVDGTVSIPGHSLTIDNAARIQSSGVGESEPRYKPPSLPDNRARNRRVEIIHVGEG